jgi:enamine deaminase RidA (YjgF/YER057c/UK114 family)
MRIAFILVCLTAASIFSGLRTTNQTKETPKVTEKSAVRFIKSGTLPPSPGYSQAVEIRPGARIIYIAGQVAMDGSGKLIGGGAICGHKPRKHLRI